MLGVLAAAIGVHATLDDDSESGKSGPDASDLSVPQLAGERLVAGFAAREPPPELRQMIKRGELAGVVLFSNNFSDRAEARRLVHALQSIRRPQGLRDPLLVMADQEGGPVKRLPGPPLASASEMGRRGASFSSRQGRLTGRNLTGVGINLDLAPVLDVGRPSGAIAGEGRSFGASTAQVSGTAVPFARGLQAAGVAATGKHFPGLGAANVNTDLGVERIDLPAATLRGVDEAPFRSFVGAGGELVMMSSAIYPAFSERPAAFAHKIATGELRRRLGFDGVSVTDDLQSSAAHAFGGSGRVAKAAAAAGTDLLLFRSYRAAAQAGTALRAALHARTLPRNEFQRSAQRVLELRAGLRF